MSRRPNKSRYYNKKKPKQVSQKQQNDKLQKVVSLSQDLMSALIDLIEEVERDKSHVELKEQRDLFANYIINTWRPEHEVDYTLHDVYLKAKALFKVGNRETQIGETTPAPQGD